MPRRLPSNSHARARRLGRPGFTLVEVIVATLIASFVVGSVTLSLYQLTRSREMSRERLDAHLRADAAIEEIRRNLVSVIRHEDLFWTRVLIEEDAERTPWGELGRSEVLVFNTQLRAIHDIEFGGEGMQYETQFRIQEHNDRAPVLWRRRDPVPDEFPRAGGQARPVVEGIVGLRIEAYDGYEWYRQWDSDEFGLPHAIRVEVTATGARTGGDPWDAPAAVLRTVIPIDRVIPPEDYLLPDEEAREEEELEDVTDPTQPGGGQSPQGGQNRDRGGRDRDGESPDRPDVEPAPGRNRGGRGAPGRR